LASEEAEPRKRRWWLAALGLAVAVIAIFGGVRIFDVVAHTCGDDERSTFLEFPQYGAMVLQPGNDIDSGGCVASFETADPQSAVIGYYRRQLEQHGWTVQDVEQTTPEAGPGGGGESQLASVVLSAVPTCPPSATFCASSLDATRGGSSFSVAVEATQGTTSVVVRVTER
jgi:hypothetical protein